jgi:multidrug efflux system membrane fusion protein
MRLVRWAVLTAVAVVICGAAWQYRDQVAAKLGIGVPASAAEKGASPAATAQPQGRRGRANPGGPVPVVATKAVPKSMPIIVEAVGTVQSIASIQLKTRIDSQITKILVEEGALVKEGDLLFELDARTLKAQLGQIEAQIRKDQAQLEQAKRDTVRAGDLMVKGAGTVVQRDTNYTTEKAAAAQLEADEAMRQNILAQISYTEIRAPV